MTGLEPFSAYLGLSNTYKLDLAHLRPNVETMNASGFGVLGSISGVIPIIDGVAKVRNCARSELKSDATLEAIALRLPALRDTLQTCHEHFEPTKASLPTDVASSLVTTVENCKSKAAKAWTTSKETIPDDRWHECHRKVTN